MSRFDRQTILPDFGTEGQRKLSEAKVLVVGAGGLGSPVLLHLAAAGVGNIGIADGDSVSESNLNRQTLFGHKDTGKPKAATAAAMLQEKYPEVKFNVIPTFLTSQNALDIIKDYDVVVDGSDNFATRYMINDACVLLEIPLIMGAIYQYEGQLAVFNHGEYPINYRDLFPDPPQSHEFPNCSEAGVLGVLPGIIGTLQAAEAIKLLSGVGSVLFQKVLLYNLKTAGFFEVQVKPDPKSKENIPQSREAFEKTDYHITCGTAESIPWAKALDWCESLENCQLIDIRETGEEPKFDYPGVRKLPMSVLKPEPGHIKEVENLMLFCKSGQRSRSMAAHLKELFPEKKIYSIEGGILDPASPLRL